ncbi:hypothetical protein HZS_5895 [Henneguya salminicola]|nr:hypothetical protein HZS_5895 [Henneguya salminicola]
MKYGYPGNENIYFRDKYVFSYNYKHKQPNWVMESIHSRVFHDYDTFNRRSSCKFIPDPAILPMFSSQLKDFLYFKYFNWFRNSGFDRGHLAAYANHMSNYDDNCSTFYLSNVSPQIGVGFNRNIWEQLESHARLIKKMKYKKLYTCTGPLFISKFLIKPKFFSDPKKCLIYYNTIGKNQVSVPTHFFKIILGVANNKVYEVEVSILFYY